MNRPGDNQFQRRPRKLDNHPASWQGADHRRVNLLSRLEGKRRYRRVSRLGQVKLGGAGDTPEDLGRIGLKGRQARLLGGDDLVSRRHPGSLSGTTLQEREIRQQGWPGAPFACRPIGKGLVHQVGKNAGLSR